MLQSIEHDSSALQDRLRSADENLTRMEENVESQKRPASAQTRAIACSEMPIPVAPIEYYFMHGECSMMESGTQSAPETPSFFKDSQRKLPQSVDRTRATRSNAKQHFRQRPISSDGVKSERHRAKLQPIAAGRPGIEKRPQMRDYCAKMQANREK